MLGDGDAKKQRETSTTYRVEEAGMTDEERAQRIGALTEELEDLRAQPSGPPLKPTLLTRIEALPERKT